MEQILNKKYHFKPALKVNIYIKKGKENIFLEINRPKNCKKKND